MIDSNNKSNWTNMRNPTQQTWFPSPDELEWDEDEIDTKEILLPNVVPVLTWEEIYEANKKGEYCVACGKKLEKKQVLSTIIGYCKCVEELIE